MTTTYPVLRWQVGDVRISRVVESEGPTPIGFLFPDCAPEKLLQHAWLKPNFFGDDGKLRTSIHAFVVESKGKRIVVLGGLAGREFFDAAVPLEKIEAVIVRTK